MATSPIEIDAQILCDDPLQLIDRLCSLPDELLVTIRSLLPTRTAARTSVLCRRFRHLWEASSSVDLDSLDLPEPDFDNFIAMADRALLRRDSSHTLLRLRLYACGDSEDHQMGAILPSLLIKAHSLGLRHLAVDKFPFRHLRPVLTTIFSINSLQSLSFYTNTSFSLEDSMFSSRITSTRLKTLSLGRIMVNRATDLNRLLSELCSLEDLSLNMRVAEAFRISSQTIKKPELIISGANRRIEFVGLSIPSLELLHFSSTEDGFLESLPHIDGELPLLRKVALTLVKFYDKYAAARLLNSISHVEELSLDIRESYTEYPFPILLEPGKQVPIFPNLKHLDMTACFHKHNFEAVVSVLHHSPALESVKLVHKTMDSDTFYGPKKWKIMKTWASKLPRNADGNHYAYFTNLHLEENHKEYEKWLNRKSPKRLSSHNNVPCAKKPTRF